MDSRGTLARTGSGVRGTGDEDLAVDARRLLAKGPCELRLLSDDGDVGNLDRDGRRDRDDLIRPGQDDLDGRRMTDRVAHTDEHRRDEAGAGEDDDGDRSVHVVSVLHDPVIP